MLDRFRELVRPFYLRQIYFRLFPHRKPSYFSDCWRYPDLESLPERNGKPVLLFLPMNDWHTRIQRTQHLAVQLSLRGYRCIYLNPHLGREFPSGFDSRNPTRITRLGENLFELHVDLPREPVFHHRALTPAESGQIASAVDALLAPFGAERLVQILAFPVWLETARLIRTGHRAPIFYDCHDYLPGFSGIAQAIVELEPETFRSSDAILCSSASLVARAKSIAPDARIILLRNATSAQFLQISRKPSAQVAIGYIGALDSWFDIESIAAAATAHPDWQFQLVGRIENPRVEALRRFPNLHFPGEIPFAQLGRYLASFAVGTIPFILNPLIEATDPIKAYEYLATGLPVVSANLPELDRFEGLIARYLDPADFVRKLETAVATDSDALSERRRAVAALETWEERAEILSSLVDSFFSA